MENNQEPFRYQIIRKINSGGMASVFLAIDSKLGREVARLKRFILIC
jgi:serine/threonine protein kinase